MSSPIRLTFTGSARLLKSVALDIVLEGGLGTAIITGLLVSAQFSHWFFSLLKLALIIDIHARSSNTKRESYNFYNINHSMYPCCGTMREPRLSRRPLLKSNRVLVSLSSRRVAGIRPGQKCVSPNLL